MDHWVKATSPALMVDPMVPNLMFEKVTEEFGLLFSTSSGFPESVEQVPLLDPFLVEPTG